MATPAQLQTYLSEAEAALHKLLIGVKEVSVGYEGQNVTFTAADEARLRAYIDSLKSKLGQTKRRPFRPVF